MRAFNIRLTLIELQNILRANIPNSILDIFIASNVAEIIANITTIIRFIRYVIFARIAIIRTQSIYIKSKSRAIVWNIYD